MAKRRTVSIATRSPRDGDTDWNRVVERAKELVESYDTGVTLRQLYYRLVSEALIPNKVNAYKVLSRKTALARREGWFPALIDRTREIERYAHWVNADVAMEQAHESFRVDRTEGQEWSIYLGVEKHGMSVQLMDWFGALGVPVLALGGYSSQTFVDEVRTHIESQNRPSILLYAGDFDASGVDIDRDFEERTEIFDKTVRVALLRKHLKQYNLPPMPGKAADARTASFILKHGESIQVELDALTPKDLRSLYQKQIDKYWDRKAYDAALKREAKERKQMERLARYASLTVKDIALDTAKEVKDEDIMNVVDALMDRVYS